MESSHGKVHHWYGWILNETEMQKLLTLPGLCLALLLCGCTPFGGLETIPEAESPLVFAAPGLENAPHKFGRHKRGNVPGGFIKVHIGERMGMAPDAELFFSYKRDGDYSSYKPDLTYLLARSRGGGSVHGKALIANEELLSDPEGYPHRQDYQLVMYREEICLVFSKAVETVQPSTGTRFTGWITGYYCPPADFIPGLDDVETLLASLQVRPERLSGQ